MTGLANHLDRIDVLRAVAILSVYFCHALPFATGRNDYELLGVAGVALFFVISGFCIHYSYLKQREKDASLSLCRFTRTFWWRRFWRIYPPYLAALLAFWFLESRHTPLPAWHLWTHIFLVNNFSDKSFYSIAAPFWSLAVEWQFYLIYPAFLLLLRRTGLKWALVCCLLTSVILRAAALTTLQPSQPFNPAIWYASPALFFDWTLGVLIAELWTRKRLMPALEWPAIPAAILCVLSDLNSYTRPFCFTLAAVAGMGLMSFYLRRPGPPGVIEQLFIPLGVCSYSFYLWHHPLIGRVMYWLHKSGLPDNPAMNMGGICLVTLGCLWAWSRAFYKLTEQPSIHLGRTLWSRCFSRGKPNDNPVENKAPA